MLRFVESISTANGGWGKGFSKVVLPILKRHFKIVVYPYTDNIQKTRYTLLSETQQGDIVFLTASLDTLSEDLREGFAGNVTIAGVAHHIFGHYLEPWYSPAEHTKELEIHLLNNLDFLFPVTGYAARKFPVSLRPKIIPAGFPMDFSYLDKYRGGDFEERLVVISQRFAIDKNFPLLIEIVARLTKKGFKCIQMIGGKDVPGEKNPLNVFYVSKFRSQAEKAGLIFQFNETKEQYLETVAKADSVLFTTLLDNVCVSGVEAAYLGKPVIMPDVHGIKDIFDTALIYEPYTISKIIDLVENPVRRDWFRQLGWLSAENVVATYVEALK